MERAMSFLSYTWRYLWVLAQIRYEENYWDQVFINDLWVKILETMVDNQ